MNDIHKLASYIIESEDADFFEHICNNDYIVYKGILTNTEQDNLAEGEINDPEIEEALINKAASNPKCDHIYAVAYRVMESIGVNERIWNEKQSWYYESTLTISGRKIKIEIRRNAYDFQSWAIALLFDGNKWNQIAHIPHPQMKCMHVSYVGNASVEDFREDTDALIKEVTMLISD